MEKSILALCTVATIICLSAFDFVNRGNIEEQQNPIAENQHSMSDENSDQANLDLYFDVDNRWRTTITKEELSKVKDIQDLIQDEYLYLRKEYRNVRIDVLHNDKDVRDVDLSAVGQSPVFNTTQLNLLQSLTSSTNFRVTALNTRTKLESGEVREDSLIYYITIVPEKQAAFEGGMESLLDYLKIKSKVVNKDIDIKKLQSGKYHFTVSKYGTIDNVRMVETAGFESVDEELVRILSNMPQKWTPAENEAGEKVSQELVFSFGLMGC